MAEDIEERTIELTIEALTGTVYDLCVSPYETILGIKMKVQRLEGIPVYQQQLVWGGMELQDEFCLEEYSIPSGAQLKLLVAMRGGPIHAQRVHLDLEDPTFLEIAELLDSQGGDKYTLMLLRNGDDLDHASFVQFQMFEEESMDALRLSPIQLREPGQRLGVGASKTTRSEHAVTKDKMKDLMAKLKKGKSYRQPPPPPYTASSSSNQLPRKGTGKVLILESRTPSRLLHSSAKRTPLSSARTNEARLAQRKLVFPNDEYLQHSGKQTRKRMTSCSLASRRTRNPEEETPIVSRKPCSRLTRETGDTGSPACSSGVGRLSQLLDHSGIDFESPSSLGGSALPGGNDWHKPSKRKRRTSRIDCDNSITAITNLSKNFARMDLDTPLPSIDQYPELEPSGARTDFLPPIPHPRLPISFTSSSTKELTQPLPVPSLSITGKQSLNMSRKKRCMKCGKKMGLASTYSCRCGGLFCANHRYAETHSCSFDYKTEGREMISRSNPVVAAQKLPKI